MKILIVDDSPYERAKVRQFVEAFGHTVVESGDGNDAIVQLFDDGILDPSFGAIITDMRMSPGASGLWLLQYLNRSGVRLPCLLHSTKEIAREKGYDFDLHFTSKVFDFAEFHVKSESYEYIEKFLGRLL